MLNRDSSIDILRGIALIAIVATHVYPSEVLWQFFDYNVCLIVFVSGISYSLSQKKYISYFDYIFKRIKRILVPTWTFLVLYFGTLIVGSLLLNGKSNINSDTLFHYFTLQSNWYIWVMRVFLVTSLTAPLFGLHILRKYTYLVYVIGYSILAIYEYYHPAPSGTITYYLLMTIPYVVVFALGTIANEAPRKILVILAIVNLSIFAFYVIIYYQQSGVFLNTNNYKNPPILYYTSFGISCSYLFFLFRDSIELIAKVLKVSRLFYFVSSHTMWFYFLHIPIVIIFNRLMADFWMKFLMAIVVTTIFLYIYIRILERITSKITNERIIKNIKLIFWG